MAKLKLLIAGGGSTAEILLRDPAIREVVEEVIVIENDPERRIALERLGDIYVIEDDAAHTSIYGNIINMREITAVLALTNRDEVNFLVLAIAKLHNVPIRIGVFRDENIAEIVRNLKLGIPVVKPAITAGVIKQVVSSITTAKKYADLPLAEYKLYAITIEEDDLAANSKIEELNLQEDGAYPLMIFNGKELIPATPEATLNPGVTLFVMAQNDNFVKRIKG